MRYYSRMRPVSPGSYPCEGVSKIVNFDDRQMCEDIGCEAWGYIEYDRELSKTEVEDYELTPGSIRTWWGVTTTVYDDGKVTATLTDSVQQTTKPENKSKILSRKDIYVDWFETKGKAENFVKEAETA